MLTHFLDWRHCVNNWKLSWLSALPPFHPWKASLLLFRSSPAVCNQGGFQKPLQPSSPSFPFTPSDILEQLFDGPCLYLNLAYLSMYLRMFSYVYFYQSVPRWCLRTHAHTNMHLDTCTFVLPQRNHCRVQTSHVLSQSVSQPVLSSSFHQGTAQCTCCCWNPQLHHSVSITPIRSLPGGGGWRCGSKNKRIPGSGRKEKVWRIPLWSDVRKYWEAAREGSLKTRQERWEERWPDRHQAPGVHRGASVPVDFLT